MIRTAGTQGLPAAELFLLNASNLEHVQVGWVLRQGSKEQFLVRDS